MIDKKYLTAAAKKMMRRHRGLRDPQIIHPRRDWITGVFIAFGCFIGVAWWSSATYLHYSSMTISDSVELTDTTSVYKEAQVKSALQLFAERTETYQQLLSTLQETSLVPEEAPETTNADAATSTEEIAVEVETREE